MPKSWHDRHAVGRIDDEKDREFYRSIVAEKKPYFMRYIYPDLMREYNTYVKNTNRNAMREFGLTVDELKELDAESLTSRQEEFLMYYDLRMPVSTGDCIMNIICRKFESEFDGYVSKSPSAKTFDYSIMKNDSEYTPLEFKNIKHIYEEYSNRLKSYVTFSKFERVDDYDRSVWIQELNESFERKCAIMCPNERAMHNVLVDMCYSKSSWRSFFWSLCNHSIINNLLINNDMTISYPVEDATGDIEYRGTCFRIDTKRFEGEID